jgi:hypothetical protein
VFGPAAKRTAQLVEQPQGWRFYDDTLKSLNYVIVSMMKGRLDMLTS